MSERPRVGDAYIQHVWETRRGAVVREFVYVYATRDADIPIGAIAPGQGRTLWQCRARDGEDRGASATLAEAAAAIIGFWSARHKS